jgi:hypothetical protein
VGQTQLYQRQGDDRVGRVRPVLSDPAFRAVEAEGTSLGQLFLFGTVATEADRARLEERLRPVFGDDEARRLASHVEVAGCRVN